MIFTPTSILNMKYLFTLMMLFALSTFGISQDCVLDPIPDSQGNLIDCDPVIPDCLSLDVQIDSMYLVLQDPLTDPCIPGTPLLADLFAIIDNQSESSDSIALFGNIVSDTTICKMARCSGELIPLSMTEDGLGLQTIQFGSISYACGELISLTDAILVAAPSCPITCTDIAGICSYAVPALSITPPAFPDECAVTISVSCNDNNPCTVEDFEIIDPFTGAICMPCTGSGTADCYVTSLIPCNDLNPCTENDMQAIDACSGDICSPCTGTPIASCSIFINQACNDNNPCTENDVIVLDACSLEICMPCAGTLVDEPICDPNCTVYNPATCSCDPIPIPGCDDNDCSTIDTYDPVSCECVYIDISPDQCDDGICYTNDYLDPVSCNCVNEPIVVSCNDNDCSTQDIFNYNTCECEYIDVCSNVSNGGWIGYDQGNCSAFDPAPIQSLEPATGGCGDIEYMWLQSDENVPYTGLPNSSWTIIPGANGLTYDPGLITSGVMCFLRCARTESCTDFPGESNVVCITVGTTEVCNDWDCTTEDYFNPNTCECEYTTISTPSCNDNNCGTEDNFNPETCECEYTAVCNNVTFPGNISGNQESCGPFDPEPINNINLPAGGCGELEYIWIQSTTNVFSNGGVGTPWTTIPGATGPSYDPGFLSQTTYFRRCARSSGCFFYIGESNIICVEVTLSETCDDGNCNTLDTYDPVTCECTHIDVTPVCDDNNCNTEDVYDALTCTCSHIPISPPDCNDNDCNTNDFYDSNNCQCVYEIIPPPDCDDNNCATTDLFDVLTCTCVNVLNPPVDCDDNDCETNDFYNTNTCECEYENIILPDCDDDDCLTIDTYDPATCECMHTSIEVDNCDDNDCTTHDSYDTVMCECVYTPIPPPDCDDDNCNTTDSYNTETCLCENIPIDIPDCDDNDCNTEDLYDVTICDCVNTLIPPPDCDDNDCNTLDSYDNVNCACINTLITPPDCDDNDCNTEDFYDPTSCECMNTIIQIPDCDDNDCNTNDFYDDSNCECVNETIAPPDCDDNDCNTIDEYNSLTCQCEYTDIPVEIVCSAFETIDIFLDEDGNAFITAADIDNGSTAGCDGTPELSIDITAFSCNNIGPNEVKLTVAFGMNSECCTTIVNVVDNILPTVLSGFCPPDVTIACDDDISDLNIYGDVDFNQLDDNCALAYTVNESILVDLDDCGIGTIDRTFTILDIPGNIVFDTEGNQIVCVQTITIEGDATPLVLSDITWPASPLNLDCSELIPDSEVIIDDSGFACANINTTSSDVIANQDGDCSLTIDRTFVVTDNCQEPPVSFSFVQTINIIDTTAPTINDAPDDLMLDLTGAANECSSVVTLSYNVTDDCINPQDLELSIDAPGFISQSVIDANGDVSFDVEFCSLDEDVTITLTASDGCGNISTDVMQVTVIGGECISYNCQKFIFALDADGESEFNANDFPVVINQCDHIEIDISYDGMDIQDTLLVLNCDSIAANGQSSNFDQFLYFWLDGELIDSCRIVIFFSDDPNGDGDPADGWRDICGFTNFSGTIAGTVLSMSTEGVPNVEVSLIGSPFETEMTGSVGDYIFPIMEFGGNYEVIPQKDDDHLNGVSTLDIILIQKHILGLNEFDSPYKHIAADANNSGSVSALDLINIRKLILGVNNEFENNTSWRMVEANYEFADPNDPLKSDWPESHHISGYNANMFVEFVGVKVGDVNNSAVNDIDGAGSEVRSSKSCGIGFNEEIFEMGDELVVELRPDYVEGLEGVQFEMSIDPNFVNIEDVVFNETALCEDRNIHIVNVAQGLIAVSWNTSEELKGNESLFSLKLKAIKAGTLSEILSLKESQISAEAYFSGLIGDLNLVPKSPTQGDIVLYQNRPNPWMESTSIQYYLPQDELVELNVYGINGALIKSLQLDSKKGLNEYQIERTELNHTGVFYYELTCNKSKQIKKMLILE